MDVSLILRQRRHEQSGGLPALRFLLAGIGLALFSVALVALVGVAALLTFYSTFARDLPSAEEIQQLSTQSFETTRLYDRTGRELLWEIVPPDTGLRSYVPLSEIPETLRNATIASEDKTFYTNLGGVNWEGFARAVLGELTGQDAGGGSSISQQLVRNVIMPFDERVDRSQVRKIKEIVLAIELSRQYPGIEGRNQILEWYLNNIFYGRMAYGVEAAAQTYFGKPVSELTLPEAAMLVPIGNSPAMNPIDAPEQAKRRQEIVLDLMAEQGYLTEEQVEAAKQTPLVVASTVKDMKTPHWVIYVRDRLIEQFGSNQVYGGGLQVVTTIDLNKQRMAETAAREHIAEIAEERNAHNAAVVILDAKRAEILAMVGSLDYEDDSIDGQVNMALSPRQPGSSFKPFTYVTGFMQGYTPATMLMDVRTSFPNDPHAPYVPENYSRRFSGPVLVRDALARSLNVPAVAMMHKVGLSNVLDTAHAMGISTLRRPISEYGLSLTLGGGEVRLLDMAYAFSVFGNNGQMRGVPVPAERQEPGFRKLDPVAVLSVTGPDGQVLYEYGQPFRQQVIEPQVAYLITDILSDNQARIAGFGPDNALELEERPAAAKTGSTNNFRDGWTVGYTPQYVVGVWVGNTGYEEMVNAPGARTAAPIWQRVMKELHNGLPVEPFTRPEGLVTAVVDGESGRLPTDASPWRKQEIFVEGTVPTESDDIHRIYRICRTSGKLATIDCPPSEVDEVVFSIYPPDAADWVREQEIPQPPTEYCDLHGASLTSADLSITSPKLFGGVGGIVPIEGNARVGGQQRYWLQVGRGMDPSEWIPVGPEHGHSVANGVLESWDTTGLEDGLYTLKLSAMTDAGLREFTTPVRLDNTPPEVAVINPNPDPERTEQITYVIGKDEWINIQVDAVDNQVMDRVEFYMDDELLGSATVAPYTLRWTLELLEPSVSFDLPAPVVESDGERTVRREVLRQEDQVVYRETIEHGGLITVTDIVRVTHDSGYTLTWSTGQQVIQYGDEYTETHAIYAIAYDAAGNETKSEPALAHVIPKERAKLEIPDAFLPTPSPEDEE
jgi:penicillin-binding protein 1C